MVNGEFSKLDSPDTRNHIFHQPLTPEDIEKLQARGTNVCAVGNRKRDLTAMQVIGKLRINKVGMICRMAQKDFPEIERFVDMIALKPSLIEILLKSIRFIP